MSIKEQENSTSGILRNLIVNTLSIFAASYILRGVHVDSFLIAILVAVVMSVLNVTLKPLLILITIPFTLVTFGLFLLVINVLVIYAAAALIDGFDVDGFWWALLFSLLVSIVNGVLFGLGRQR
jgi:putative membrane protein